ncbi:helix-turn-helix domain-containing protein [Deinococcus aquiradiocola]|nr:helix-turn-helix transcriptional regulator [Deinococcus aquiradiocola]
MRSPHPIRFQLAHNMRAFRKQVGMTQEQLAASAGLHVTYVNEIERGKRNVAIDNIGRIAEALNVAPALLLSSAEPDL